jgi:hypothetical protein
LAHSEGFLEISFKSIIFIKTLTKISHKFDPQWLIIMQILILIDFILHYGAKDLFFGQKYQKLVFHKF